MTPPVKIVLAGGSGFLGGVLARWFAGNGWEVVVLTRHPSEGTNGVTCAKWDGRNLSSWKDQLENAKAVINLSGRSVNCRYTPANRREILQSRIEPTRVIAEAINACANPPRLWLNASTATIYRHTYGPAHAEDGEIGATDEAKDAFSVDVARAWEETFNNAGSPGIRKVAMRTAMVLGLGRNSVFPMLRKLARMGLGGRMSHGRQFVSWVHEEDFCRAIEWVIEHQEVAGVVNIAAPNPVTNREMMRIVRRECGLPAGLPAPLWLLEIGAFFMRTETELIIKSRRVVPGRLLDGGFRFRFETFQAAIRDLEEKAVGGTTRP